MLLLFNRKKSESFEKSASTDTEIKGFLKHTVRKRVIIIIRKLFKYTLRAPEGQSAFTFSHQQRAATCLKVKHYLGKQQIQEEFLFSFFLHHFLIPRGEEGVKRYREEVRNMKTFTFTHTSFFLLLLF